MNTVEAVLPQCTHILPGHGPRQSMKATLQAPADTLDGSEYPDNYGEGDYLASFESELAALFGQEAAVFMPSGTMAQQIALRIWCQRRSNFSVAMHPTAHPEFAELAGYCFLHHLQRLQFGAPEFVGNQLLMAAEKGVPLHLDGARIWQCRPFYQKSYTEIAALFDSIYVSFYKDLGGLSGSMLMGPTWLINEARVWPWPKKRVHFSSTAFGRAKYRA